MDDSMTDSSRLCLPPVIVLQACPRGLRPDIQAKDVRSTGHDRVRITIRHATQILTGAVVGGHPGLGVRLFALQFCFYTFLLKGTLEGLDHLDHLGVIEEPVLVVRDDHELVAADALFAQGRLVTRLLLNLCLLGSLEHVCDAR